MILCHIHISQINSTEIQHSNSTEIFFPTFNPCENCAQQTFSSLNLPKKLQNIAIDEASNHYS
jgi:hypothetical protein